MLESGLPQPVLAHIWNLCDMKETGKLNAEQFALARYFIQHKQNGQELPAKLLPNMIPPTLRPKPLVMIQTPYLMIYNLQFYFLGIFKQRKYQRFNEFITTATAIGNVSYIDWKSWIGSITRRYQKDSIVSLNCFDGFIWIFS